MGDRANVYVREPYQNEEQGVYLYTHWGGSELARTVQKALQRKLRWDDSQYLARIIFCTMISEGGDSLEGEVGFGISTAIGDNSYSIIVIDTEHQTVSFTTEDKRLIIGWPFNEYIELSENELREHWK
jgi:hypothetical protein